MFQIRDWRVTAIVLAAQVVICAVSYLSPNYATVTLYCATILFAALRGGYSLGILSAATATTMFIFVKANQQEAALFWLKHGIDVVFMLALGVVVGRLVDEQQETTTRSLRDPLTGLFNRGYLNEQLKSEIDRSRRYGHRLSLLMIDIDHFKSFNDRRGHQTGDTVLKQVGHILATRCRSADIACRYGGEEFCMILPETPLAGCVTVGDRLREQVSNSTLYSPGIAEKVTISIGAAELIGDITDGQALVKAADKALYEAKERGRDRIVLADQPEGVLESPAPAADGS